MAVDQNETRRQRILDALADGASRTWTRTTGGSTYTFTLSNPQIRFLADVRVFSVEVLVTRDGTTLFDDRVNMPNPATAIRNAAGVPQDGPLQAIRDTLLDVVRATTDNLRVARLQRNPDGSFKGDTLAVRSTAADGKITSTNATWNTALDGSGLAADTTGTLEAVASTGFTVTYSYLDFDTSSLGAGATITGAIFTLYGNGTAESNANSTTIEIRSFNWGGTLTTADWVDANPSTGWTNLTRAANKGLGTWNQTNNNQNDFTDDGNYSTINQTGVSYFVMGLARVGVGTPTGANSMVTYSADNAGTTSDPLLTVTYTPATTGSGAPTLAAITASGTGTQTISGTGPATLGAITASGSGLHTTGPFGSGAVTLGAITASGAGSLQITGTGTATLGAMSASGTGTHVDQRLTVVELDLDGDGVFEADITSYVLSVESLTGRDRASHLTGKASPGKLTVLVNNADDRFSDFNSNSPYYGQIVPGARIRWRDANALTDDPVLLVQDRFNRAAGVIGTTENSLTWDNPGSALAAFTVANSRAIPSSEGNPNLSTVAISYDSYYVQATVSQLGSGNNLVGICYRWVSDNDYSLLVVDFAQESLKLIDVVTGTQSIVEELGTEIYSGITIGVLVDGTDETVYLEGVPFIGPVATAHAATNEVGIYAEWDTGADRPDIDDFFVWDHLPVEVDGIFWTGRLTEPRPSVQAGPLKTATLEAVGPLAELARSAVTPPTSLQGKRTGLLMGNVLALSGHLRPPGPIEMGDITTGIFVAERWSYAINIARLIEDTELGFLFETQEGHIGFRSRSYNDGVTQSDVSFAD